jgi:hypothetical protein
VKNKIAKILKTILQNFTNGANVTIYAGFEKILSASKVIIDILFVLLSDNTQIAINKKLEES